MAGEPPFGTPCSTRTNLEHTRAMSQSNIVVRGAREHNLKGFDVTLPRDSLIVITGLSGSGKSSLAFDTIYAEGQRRYVESLSAYGPFRSPTTGPRRQRRGHRDCGDRSTSFGRA